MEGLPLAQTERLFRQVGRQSWFDMRIFTSAFVILALIAFFAVAWYARPRLQERVPNSLANVIVVGFVCVFLLLASTTLAFTWKIINTELIMQADFGVEMATAFQVGSSAALLATSYVVAGFIRQGIQRVIRGRDAFSKHQTQVMVRVAQVCVYVVGLTAVLGVWEVDITGLLVGAGFLGIVVGMAARQTLGSLLAGFMLMFARPFEIGDWVIIEEEEGIVTDISIVNTRIQTFDGEYVMIPNDIVGGSTIINRSRKGRLRLEVDVGVDYEADVERAAAVAKEVMREPDDVLAVPSPQVVTKELGDSAVVLGLRFWIDKPSARRKWRAKTTVINAVKEAFDREGIKIPFPQRELSGRAETGGFRVAEERERTREFGATADGGATDGGTTDDGPTDGHMNDGGPESDDGGENE
ncbi:mechanosensitive ion channel protein MscS [Haladaptatus sp. W1]|uniref:mechanosensitive ion channel family protein n=1 Tax=Haladaptatus sp. W1 TaxID=1897478 RepID=UPI000849A92C|nr:mechanosensitive ion channel family protein [Haladaptatus sp. W1]ODR83009.1 mechanosensitive ion channel protein MscS [Haladaptatus sp. W1]